MAAKSRPGIERLEAERLALGCLDHVPDIDTHSIIKHLQFIDECDVDGAVGVFKNLACLCHLGARDGHDPDDHPSVKCGCQFQTGGLQAADDLGDGWSRELRVAWVFAFRAECQEKVLSRLETPSAEDGKHHIPGSAWIGCALEHDQLARTQFSRDGMSRADYVSQVGLTCIGQRGWNANDDDIGLIDSIEG